MGLLGNIEDKVKGWFSNLILGDNQKDIPVQKNNVNTRAGAVSDINNVKPIVQNTNIPNQMDKITEENLLKNKDTSNPDQDIINLAKSNGGSLSSQFSANKLIWQNKAKEQAVNALSLFGYLQSPGNNAIEARGETMPKAVEVKVNSDYYSSLKPSYDRINIITQIHNDKQSKLMQLEAKLIDLPTYTSEYTNIIKQIQSVKKGLSQAETLYQNETDKINDLNKQRQEYEDSRGPYSSYFSQDNLRKDFIAKTLTARKESTNQNDVIDSISSKYADGAQQSLMDKLYEVATDLTKAGSATSDSYYDSPAVIDVINNYANAKKQMIKDNYDKLLGADGQIDKNKLDSVEANDTKFLLAARKADKFLNQQVSDSNDLLFSEKEKAAGTRIGKFFYDVGWGKNILSNKYRDFRSDFVMGSTKNGIEEPILPMGNVRSFPQELRDMALTENNTANWRDKLQSFLFNDPVTTATFVATLPLMSAGGEATELPEAIAGVSKAAQATKTAKIISEMDTLPIMQKFGMLMNTVKDVGEVGIRTPEAVKSFNATNRLRRGVAAGKSILYSIPFNVNLDSSNKTSNPLVNMTFDAFAGAIGVGQKLGLLDSVTKDIFGAKDMESALLEKFGTAFTKEDLKDTSALYDKIGTVLSTTEGKRAFFDSAYTKYMNGLIDNLSPGGVENLTNMQKKFDMVLGKKEDIFAGAFSNIDENLQKFKALTPEEQASAVGQKLFGDAKQQLKDINNATSIETKAALTNSSIINSLNSNVFDVTRQKFLKLTNGNEDMATVLATQAVMGGERTVNGIIKTTYEINPALATDLQPYVKDIQDTLNNVGKLQDKYVGVDMVGNMIDQMSEEAKLKGSLAKLTAEGQDDLKYLGTVSDNNDVYNSGISQFYKSFSRNVIGNKVASTMSKVGKMVKNMVEQTGQRKDTFMNIVGDIFDSIAKPNLEKLEKYVAKNNLGNAKTYMKDMVNNFVTGDFTTKEAIKNANKTNGLDFLNIYFDDIHTGLVNSVEATSLLGGKSFEETVGQLGIDNVINDVNGAELNKFLKNAVPEWNTFTKPQKALIKGISGNGTSRIAPFREVARGFINGLRNGIKTVVLPAAYCTTDGLELMYKVMGGVDGFSELLANSFINTVKEQTAVVELGSQFYQDGKLMFNIAIDGNDISFFDMLQGLDTKLTMGLGGTEGGLIQSKFMVLTKYFQYDKEASAEFYKSYSEGINKLFYGNEEIGRINDILGYKYKKNTIGENYIELIKDIQNKLREKGMDEVKVIDLTHPLIFNPQEYIKGIRNMSFLTEEELKTAVDSKDGVYGVIGELLYRHGANNFPKEDLLELNELFGNNQTKNFISMGNSDLAQELRNKNAQDIEGIMADQMKSIGSMPIPKDKFEGYLYDVGGYLVVNPKIGFTSNLNQSVIGDINEIVTDVTKGLDKDIQTKILQKNNSMLSDIFTDMQNGNFEESGKKIEEYKKFLSDQDIQSSNINGMLQQLEDGVKKKKQYAGNSVYQQKFFDMLNKKPEFVNAPQESLEQAVAVIEKHKESINTMIDMDTKAKESFVANEIRNIDLLSNGGKPLYDLISSMNIGDEDALAISENLGLTESQFVALKNKGTIPKEGIVKAVENLMGEGKISFQEALLNDSFRESIATSMEEEGKNIKSGSFYAMDEFGNLTLDTNEKINGFFKAFASLNVLAKGNARLKTITDKLVEGPRYSIKNPVLEGINVDKINIGVYKRKFGEGLNKILQEGKISEDEYSNIIELAIQNQKSAYINLKYTGKADEHLEKLYNYISDYFNDMYKFRQEKLPEAYFNELTRGLSGRTVIGTALDNTFRPGAYRTNALNRLTGSWTYMNNSDIDYLAQAFKLGKSAEGKGISTWIPKLGHFVERVVYGTDRTTNLLFGGFFDTGIGKTISNYTTRVAMNIMFGPQAILKAPQQILNNVLHARGHIRGNSIDENTLNDLIDFIYDGIDSNIAHGQIRDIARGDESNRVGKLSNSITFSKISNVMQMADNASMIMAKKSALSDALYDMFSLGGRDAVNKFAKDAIEMDTFMQKYGLQSKDFFHKSDIMDSIKTIAEKNGDDFGKEVDEFDKYSNFYKDKLSGFKNKVRSSYRTFYASETIPELGAIGIIDNNRSMFALKKRAFSKFGEYGYGVATAMKKYGFATFARKAISGEIPVITQIAKEMAEGLRLSRAVDRGTNGEINMRTAAKYLIIPATVTMMTIGDAIEQGIYTAGDVYKAGKNVDAISNVELWSKAISMGLLDFTKNVISTSFLYNYAAVQPFAQGYKTAVASKDNLANGISAILKQLFVKPFTKYFSSSYGGYNVDSDFDGNFTTNLVETALNMYSTTRTKQQNMVSSMFDSSYFGSQGRANYMSSFTQSLFKNTFITGQFGADMGILQKSVDQWKQTNKTDLFMDEFAIQKDKDGYEQLLDNYDRVDFYRAFATSQEGKDYMISNKIKPEELDKQDYNVLMNKAVEMGIVSPNSPVFTDTINALKGTLGTSKDVKAAYESQIPTDKEQELQLKATKLYIEHTKGGKDITVKFLNDFVSASTEMGTNYSMAELMIAMQKGIEIALKKKYGISDGRLKFGDNIEDTALISSIVGSRNTANDLAYINESRAEQKKMLSYIQPIIGRNNKIGISLADKMLQNDPESPLTQYTSKMQTINSAESYKKAIEDDGYISDNVISQFDLYKVGIMKNLATYGKQDDESMKKIYGAINNVTTQRIDTINEKVKNPYQNTVAKMGVSYALSPFIDTLSRNDNEGFKNVVSSLGNGFISMIDSLTDAVPNDTATAFEIASGINIHGKGGKSHKAKKNIQKLLKANTKAIKLAGKLSAAGYDLSPVKANYSIQKTKMSGVDVNVVNVELQKLPKPKIELPKGGSANTADLTPAVKKISRSTTQSSKPKKIKSVKSPKSL